MRRALLLVLLAGCARPALDGPDGLPGAACSFARDDRTMLVSCEDGSLATVPVGPRGAPPDPGATGDPGEDAVSPSLIEVRRVAEQPAACQGPGYLLQVRRNGTTLAERPICRPAPPCRVVHGNVTLTDSLRVLAFASAGCRELRGVLEIARVKGLAQLPPFVKGPWSVRALRIRDNPGLQGVGSLAELKGEVDELVITDNATLTSLVGLEGITRIRGPLRITGNRSLKLCEAERIRDQIGVDRIAGPITLDGLPGDDCLK